MRYLCGLGNYMKSDDSIGLRIVEHIAQNGLNNNFNAIEIGNDCLKLLNYFSIETEFILIVDCALIKKTPGAHAIFTPADVSSQKETTNLTSHESDILQVIDLAQKLNYPIPAIKILAIQPEDLKLEMKLSGTLQQKFSNYIKLALKEMTKAKVLT